MPDATSIMDFLGKLLGAAPPQPQAQQPSPDVTFAPGGRLGMIPQPATGVTTPAQPAHYSLMDVLGSPGAQGALQAYFSLLSQPRVQGWSRGLGAAGLQGLQGFEQAREAQAKLPLEQAQLQEAQARVPYLQAETRKALGEEKAWEALPAEEQKYRVLPPALATLEAQKGQNQVVHDELMRRSAVPGTPPDVAQRLRENAEMALKSAGPADLAGLEKEAWTPPGLATQKTQAEIDAAKARQKAAEQLAKEAPARAEERRLQSDYLRTRINLLKTPEYKIFTPKEIEDEAVKARKEAADNWNKAGYWGRWWGGVVPKSADEAGQSAYDSTKKRLEDENAKRKSAIAAEPAAATGGVGGGLPDLPPDASGYATDPATGEVGWHDAEGSFHSF